MDGWMDGWMNGWMDRWMDGWIRERELENQWNIEVTKEPFSFPHPLSKNPPQPGWHREAGIYQGIHYIVCREGSGRGECVKEREKEREGRGGQTERSLLPEFPLVASRNLPA